MWYKPLNQALVVQRVDNAIYQLFIGLVFTKQTNTIHWIVICIQWMALTTLWQQRARAVHLFFELCPMNLTLSCRALYSSLSLSSFCCKSLRSTAKTDRSLSASAAAASAFSLVTNSCSSLSKVLLCSARSCSVLSSRVSDNLFFSVW